MPATRLLIIYYYCTLQCMNVERLLVISANFGELSSINSIYS